MRVPLKNVNIPLREPVFTSTNKRGKVSTRSKILRRKCLKTFFKRRSISIRTARAIVPAIPFAFAQLVFGQNYLAIHGQPGIASRIVVYASVFGAVMVLLFVPWLGAIGLDGVMLACRILLGSGSIFAYRRLRRIEASIPEQSNWWANSAQ